MALYAYVPSNTPDGTVLEAYENTQLRGKTFGGRSIYRTDDVNLANSMIFPVAPIDMTNVYKLVTSAVVARAGRPVQQGEVVLLSDPITPEDKAAKASEIAAWRYTEEVGGITFNGMTIATDRDSQALLSNAITGMQRYSVPSVSWKTSIGFVQLDLNTLLAIGKLVWDHVEAAFGKESVLLAQLAAAETYADLAAIVW